MHYSGGGRRLVGGPTCQRNLRIWPLLLLRLGTRPRFATHKCALRPPIRDAGTAGVEPENGLFVAFGDVELQSPDDAVDEFVGAPL